MSAVSPAAPARPVVAVVRLAHAGLRAARALECMLLCAAGVLLARAAALLSGVESGAWGVVGLCGALAAASWWCEHPTPLRATVRALDAALRQQGALALAFELERECSAAGLSAMEELVRARVRAQLGVRAAVRAVLPPFFVPLAAPAVAALLLLLALDRRAASPAGPLELPALGAELGRVLAAALDPEHTGQAPGDVRALRQEIQELQALLQMQAGPLPSTERARAAGEARALLERLDRRLAELAALAAPTGTAPPPLDEARAWIDTLRAALPAGAGDGAGTGEGGTAPGNLTGTPADGTISRPMAESDAPPAPDLATPPGAPLGLQAGSFWPREYDTVVERWVELSRAERAGNER